MQKRRSRHNRSDRNAAPLESAFKLRKGGGAVHCEDGSLSAEHVEEQPKGWTPTGLRFRGAPPRNPKPETAARPIPESRVDTTARRLIPSALMKAPPLFLLLAFSASTLFAAQAPGDFADIKWGASMGEAQSSLASRGAHVKDKSRGADRFVLTGGTWADRNVDEWELHFVANRFVGARIVLKPDGKAEDQYRKLKSALVTKFGSGNDTQVAKRRPPHFVFGLGWRDSGTEAVPLSAAWELTSLIDKREVEIRLWAHKGRVFVQYATDDSGSGSASPAKKKKDL